MSSLLENELTKIWLRQFTLGDQRLAEDLLKRFVFVSRDEFSSGLINLIIKKASLVNGPIGLYAERELNHRLGVPHKLFKEERRKIKRAFGVGPTPVRPLNNSKPEVGSEAIVAQLVTQLCRESPEKFYSHPGPDKIRDKKIRALWIVTDFIGSGDRGYQYIESAWLVRSVRSWWSRKNIDISIVAYSSTSNGKSIIKSHNSKPRVFFVIPCPTISTEFDKEEAKRYYNLCEAYDPVRRNSNSPPWVHSSLGYGGTGALIAFAHGAPNNSPLIFHKTNRKKTWIPLFSSRVTSNVPLDTFGNSLSEERIHEKLKSLGQSALAKSTVISNYNSNIQRSFLLLAALTKAPRKNEVVALRTGLSMLEISEACDELFEFGWIDSQRRLTDAGYRELKAAKRSRTKFAVSEFDECIKSNYYPSQLREPVR